MANSVDPDQTAPIGAVCSGSTLFASILSWKITKKKVPCLEKPWSLKKKE